MATILEFKGASRPSAASVLTAFGAGRSAEIVFFPGVRYERMEDEPEETETPKQSSRRRDTLELEG